MRSLANLFAVLLLGSTLLSSCAFIEYVGSLPPPPVSEGREGSGVLLAARAVAGEIGSRDLIALADRVAQAVSALRQLSLREPIQMTVADQNQIRQHIQERLRSEYTPEEMRQEQKALVAFGLIPPDLDYPRLLTEVLTEQVAGYYDPFTKTLFLADWIPAAQQETILAHEIAHALQDQYVGLARFLTRVRGNDDLALARQAVIEGEGLAVMLDYTLRPLGQDFTQLPGVIESLQTELTRSQESPLLARSPRILRESLLFPYTAGLRFLHAARLRHTWREITALYADLPHSTEQILHPEKYFGPRDSPVTVSLDDLKIPDGTGWVPGSGGVLGEFATRVVLEEFLDREAARKASEGWGGDQYQVYEASAGGALLLLYRSAWDSPRDAQEFFDAYSKLLSKKYPTAAPLRHDRNSRTWAMGDRRLLLELTGQQVLVIEGAPADLLPRGKR